MPHKKSAVEQVSNLLRGEWKLELMSELFMLIVACGAVGVFVALPRGRASLHRAPLIILAAAAVGLVTFLLRQRYIAFSSLQPVDGWFVALTLVALTGGVRVITHPRPVYSALYFIMVIIAVAGLLLLMQAEFLAMALVMIYAGAILVTYVFVIMLAQQSGEADYDRQSREPLLAVVVGFVLLGVIGAQLFNPAVVEMSIEAAASIPDSATSVGDISTVGTTLLTQYAVGVEVVGVLLLAAMIGAIAIARRRTDVAEEGEAA